MNAAPLVTYPGRSTGTVLESTTMFEQIKTFARHEDGAVTVDWVVSTAAIVGLAIAAFAAIQQGSTSVGNNVSTYLTETELDDLHDVDS